MVDFAKLRKEKAASKVPELEAAENWGVKHRPRTLKEVYGQPHLVAEINGMFKRKQVASSYLFTGGYGRGKTTVARILAKMLNGFDPKGDNYVDIVETNAATERGIDDVRAMISGTKFMPQKGRFKVYIIDEVHQLTPHASSALLKSLEEPQPHIIFMLATNEPERLLATIRSRCYTFNLKGLSIADMVEMLSAIADKEEVFQPTVKYVKLFKAISQTSDGSARVAVQILHKLANINAGQKIDPNDKEARAEALQAAFKSLDIEAGKVAVKILLSLYKGKVNAATSALGDTANYQELAIQLMELNAYVIETRANINTWGSYNKNLLAKYMSSENIKPSVEVLATLHTELVALRHHIMMATTSDRHIMLSSIPMIGISVKKLLEAKSE